MSMCENVKSKIARLLLIISDVLTHPTLACQSSTTGISPSRRSFPLSELLRMSLPPLARFAVTAISGILAISGKQRKLAGHVTLAGLCRKN